MKKRNKIIITITSLLVGLLLLPNIVGVPLVYNYYFKDYARPDYDITPGKVNFNMYKDDYARELIEIPTDKNYSLQGYFYDNPSTTKMIIFTHGLHDGADSLLPIQMHYYDLGYDIFSYDLSGCFSSQGDLRGFSQSLIDLENVLKYLDSSTRFKDTSRVLFGLSMGGFASTSIFNVYTNDSIKGAISVSGYNDASTLIGSIGKKYAGPLVYLGLPIVNMMQNRRFKEYTSYTAVKGINNVTTPVYLVHSKADGMIRYSKEATVAYKDSITNPSVSYYIDETKDHAEIFYTDNAIEYQHEVKHDLKKLKSYDKKKEYNQNVDHSLFSELDDDLFTKLDEFTSTCFA